MEDMVGKVEVEKASSVNQFTLYRNSLMSIYSISD
jgi:hypothetical protein